MFGKAFARRRPLHKRRLASFRTEPLETRTLLAAEVTAAMPARIDPGLAGQALFAPDISQCRVDGPANGVGAHYYRFANDAAAARQTTFDVAPVNITTPDAGLALYDADGNRLAAADRDANPARPGFEQLTATLEPGRTYILGTFLGARPPFVRQFDVGVTLGAQDREPAVPLTPLSGAAHADGQFASARDVDFFPIDFSNARDSATITVTGTAPDVRVRAALWSISPQSGPLAPTLAGDEMWVQAATGSGESVHLQPAFNPNFVDRRYVLAVAPLDFDAPARSYRVDVSAPTLAPASIAAVPSTADLNTPGFLSAGRAGKTVNGDLAAGAAAVYRFRASVSGPLTLSLDAPNFAPMVAFYDAGGAALRAVRSRNAPGQINLSIDNVTAGAQYAVRVSSNGAGDPGGAFSLQVAQDYVPTPVSLANGSATLEGINAGGAAGGKFFRVALPPGADAVAWTATNVGDPGVTVVQLLPFAGDALVYRNPATGQPMGGFLDARDLAGQLDVFVASADAPVTVRLALSAADIPDTLPLGATASADLDLSTGDLSFGQPAGAAGSVAAHKFYALRTGAPTEFVATPAGGALAAVALYTEADGALRLARFALPGDDGVARLSADVPIERYAAIAAVTLRPADGAAVRADVAGARPRGTGVMMSPEPVPRLSPSDPEPPPPQPDEPAFSSNLKIRSVHLRGPGARDLWETILPGNPVAGAPTLRIGPVEPGGSMALRLTVLDDNNAPLATITTQPGQIYRQPLPALQMPAAQNRRVRFLVEPVTGQALGDGLYTLELQVETTDPAPSQVLETEFGRSILAGIREAGAENVPVNALFTVPGQVHVFHFAWDETPFEVQTELLDPSGALNTNMKLFRASYGQGPLGPQRLGLREIPGFGTNFDYYPADRSQVDAKIVVTNVDAIREAFSDPAGSPGVYSPGRNQWYAVVKNEQGTVGDYRVRVRRVTPQVAGPATMPGGYVKYRRFLVDPRTGQSDPIEHVTFFDPTTEVLTPSGLSGAPTVRIEPYNTAIIRNVAIWVDDEAGNRVYSSTTVQSSGAVEFRPTGMLPGRRYFITTTAFGDPDVRVRFFAPLTTASATVKPSNSHNEITLLGSYQRSAGDYVRARQGPDGNFAHFNFGSAGLQQKLLFWVSAPGRARFFADLGNMTFAALSLYRGERSTGEFGQIYGRLVDFASATDEVTHLEFETYVVPGVYFLKVEGLLGGHPVPQASAAVVGDTPDAFSQVITLDPNSGSTVADNLHVVDDSRFNVIDPYRAEYDGTIEGFRSTFYKVQAPGAVRSGLLATAEAVNPPPGDSKGQGLFGVYKQTGPTAYAPSYGDNSAIDLDEPNDDNDDKEALTNSGDLAQPGDVYYLALHRDRLYADDRHVQLTAQFDVPVSATPDLVVDPLRLDPAAGRTRVTVTVRNHGYATVGASRSSLRFSNYPSDAQLLLSGFGPFTSETYTFLWDPTDTGDTATYAADASAQVQERNELNNSRSAAITSRRPSITLALDDPSVDANPDPIVWGRYVSGVRGPFFSLTTDASDPDGEGDVYESRIDVPGISLYRPSGGAPYHLGPLNFGDMRPTSAANPNLLTYSVKDQWGLRSEEKSFRMEVVPKPAFYTSVTWNAATRRYDLRWDKDIVRYDKTVADIVGIHPLPIIGDKRNAFIIALSAAGSASLNPAEPVSLPLGADLELTAFDKELFKEHWTGVKKVSDHVYVATSLEVTPRTLDVSAAAASFQLRDLELLNVRTPKIPLFSFGLPGVAAITANFSFGLTAGLDAGVKIGLNPNILVDPLNAPLRVGLMSPTFVRPTITGTAYISGDVEILGIDAASIAGSVGLTLNVTVGLDNADRSAIIPFSDLLDRLAVKVDGSLNFGLSASVAFIGEVWSWGKSIPFHVADTSTHGGILTTDPLIDGGGLAGAAGFDAGMAALGELIAGRMPASLIAGAADGDSPLVRRGSDPVGPYAVAPRPQLVIDPLSGDAFTVQVTDLDPSPARTVAGLAFATRTGGVWSALSNIPDASDAANPVLVLAQDGSPRPPAVLLYEEVDLRGAVEAQTLADRLAHRRLRYRAWDGAGWGSEQSMPALGGADSEAAAAFNRSGRGVAAWVDNAAPVPMDESGNYARRAQEIHVARWDAGRFAWLAPEALTADAVADSQPAVFVDDAGKMYVAWIRETPGGGNELVFSTNSGTGWSAPTTLPIAGLEPGGQFTSVALGSEAPGRVNVLFNYRRILPDGSMDSRLYNRPATAAAFAQPATVEVIAGRTNFSNLRTTNAPDGSLVSSWQHSDGETNEVYASVLRAPGAGGARSAWSEPARLTSSAAVEQKPAVAVEPDGTFQVVYEITGQAQPPAPGAGGIVLAAVAGDVPTVAGAGSVEARALGDVGFLDPLTFDDQDRTEVGQATGQATVINRGRVASDVTIQYLAGPRGGETVVGSEQVRLSPGATFVAQRAFTVAAGSNRFAVRLLPAGGETGAADDNLTQRVLLGVADLDVVLFQPLDPQLPPGANNPLVATVRNLGALAVPAFDVTFYAGDPMFATGPAAPPALRTVRVNGLAANAMADVTLDVADLAEAGEHVFGVLADSGWVVQEVAEGNNVAALRVRRASDPHVVADATATLLNSSGVDNARVTATVANGGAVPSPAMDVVLMRSLDGGAWVPAGVVRAPALPSGETWVASFVAPAFAGDNRYRVAIDPPGETDADMTNNAAEVGLVVTGLADLALPAAPAVSDAAPRQGRPVTLSATVVNRGIATARDVLVEVLARPVGGGSAFSVGSTRLAAVAPLSSQGVSISLDLSSLLGQYDLVALVNGPGDVLEADETNNTSPATRVEVRAGARANVIGRHLFYNNSATGEAVASDKTALRPGGAAGFANVTSFVRGINAIAIDVADLPPGSTLTADDFIFATGNGGDPGTWSAAPPPPSVTVRRGAGEGGSDRIILLWPDNSIRNTWLRVTVKSNDNTGLADADVFCFGNLVGESGDSSATLRVNALDLAAVKRALNSASTVTGNFDFNRDGRVNALDLAAVKQNLNRNLPLVTPFSAAPVLPASVVHADVDEDRWDTGPATALL